MEMWSARELVRLVVVSFAKRPLVAAHRPEMRERCSQLRAMVVGRRGGVDEWMAVRTNYS